MDKDEAKIMIKRFIFIGVWIGFCVLLASVLDVLTEYKIGDLLLIEGILLTIAGTFSVMDGKTVETNYLSSGKREKVKGLFKKSISVGISMIPMVFGGVCSMILGMMLL